MLHLALPRRRAAAGGASRATSPADLDPASDDRRRLGVALRALRLDGAAVRWTTRAAAAGTPHPLAHNGAGTIDVRGARCVEPAVAIWLRYPDDASAAPIAASPARAHAMS